MARKVIESRKTYTTRTRHPASGKTVTVRKWALTIEGETHVLEQSWVRDYSVFNGTRYDRCIKKNGNYLADNLEDALHILTFI